MLFKYIRPPFPGQVCNILRSCTATYIAAESFVCWNGSRHQKHRGTRFQGQSPTSKKETNGNKIIIIQDKILFIRTQPRSMHKLNRYQSTRCFKQCIKTLTICLSTDQQFVMYANILDSNLLFREAILPILPISISSKSMIICNK